jgi:hypothetical protein
MSQEIQNQTGLKARQLGLRLGVPRSTWQRWQTRAKKGDPLLRKSGPKKLGPLPLAQVGFEIASLRHRMKRTQGTGALYQQHRHGISRRELAGKVQEERQRQSRSKRGRQQQLRWKQANLVWAIDATEYGRDGQGQRLWVHAVKDLASRYQMEPLTALESIGVAVAHHLEKLFLQHGAPLLLKRDNGSVFNHHVVNEVLARWGVIPLNSPAYYAPYNGAIEQGIRELKDEVRRALPVPESWNVEQVAPFVAVAAAKRNYQPRRCLGGANAQDIYRERKRRGRWNKRQRHQAFEWITRRAKAILENRMKTDQRSVQTAWRHAVEAWLCDQALVEVHLTPRVLPLFRPALAPSTGS